MSGWNAIRADVMIPPSLVTVVKQAAQAATTTLHARLPALNIPNLNTDVSQIDPNTEILGTLGKALESLTSGVPAHVAVIPIAKSLPPSVIDASLPDSLASLQTWLGLTTRLSSGDEQAYQTLISRSGGNAGLYQGFLRLLIDHNDPNRPLPGQTDAVTMAMIVTGASSYASASQGASVIDQLIRPVGPVGGSGSRLIPVPNNVSARVVGGAKTPAVQVSWDPPATAITAPYFPGITMKIRRYAVIRSTSARVAAARTVLDLFTTQSLVIGMTSGTSEVIAIGTGANSQFLDTNPPSGTTDPCHYLVAWEVDVVEPGGTTTIAFDQLSAAIKVTPRSPSPARTGAATTWVSAPSATAAIPALNTAVNTALTQVQFLAGGTPTLTNRLASALQAALNMTTRLITESSSAIDAIAGLQASLTRPAPSLHVIQVTGSSGGGAFLAAELARRLMDMSDQARPPFDADEYTCCACIVASAPRMADLEPTVTLLGSLLGPATPDNPLVSVLSALDTAVTQAEAAVFGPGMTPIMTTGIDPLTGLVVVQAKPVISDSGVPVGTTDPANPNQGDTNVTPPSTLC